MSNLMENNSRGNWSSKFGFLMAAVGSAVGLGNIWRFPYIAGQYGGALFLIIYVALVAILGFTMLTVELSVGRNAQASVLKAFKREGEGKGKNWSVIGWLCLITTFLIVSYYSVIGGWLIKYISGYASGGGFVSNGDYGGVFNTFVSDKLMSTVFNAIFLIVCIVILAFGVKSGIEKVSKILMPALFVMLLFVAIVSICLPNSKEGIKFFLVPNIDRIEDGGGFWRMLEAAMGQAFFSLSVGMGISTTYGSYLKKESNIVKDAVIICGFDTLVAVIAGFAILPAIFSAGQSPAQGPGLLFISLPAVFNNLGVFGNFIAVVFFALVFFAAITSAISLLEVLISSLSEKAKLKRVPATIIVGAVILVTSTLVSISQSGAFKLDLLGAFDMLTVKLLLPVTAILMCLYTSIAWKTENAVKELCYDMDKPYKWLSWWKVSVKYVTPVLMLSILVLGFVGLDLSPLIIG